MSMDIDIDKVVMRFGDFVAVKESSLRIPAGEFFSFLGPSGCGKTTILRMISGFLEPTEGSIRIGGQEMRGIGPNRRPTALIFQNLALFPLMKVWENVAFGLEVRGVGKAARRRRAEELIDLVALQGQADKLVTELSGGQRQRVAIARALAVEPAVLLLDEPLSALDLKLRQHMRAELRAIQKRTGVTFIYITHDQGEALTMSDRIAVMSQGEIEQVDSGAKIYDEPSTAFVATFVGENNPFYGRVMSTDGEFAVIDSMLGPLRGRNKQRLIVGDRAILFVRPERCRIANGHDPENAFASTIDRVDLEGSFRNLFVRGEGSREIVVHQTNDGQSGHLRPGQRIKLGFDAQDAIVLQESGLSRQ